MRVPRCENPACGKPLAEHGERVRSGKRHCGAPCRAERARLAKAGITTRRAWQAHLRAQGDPGESSRKRRDTAYVVFRREGPLVLIVAGMGEAHSREALVDSLTLHKGRYVAIPARALKTIEVDG